MSDQTVQQILVGLREQEARLVAELAEVRKKITGAQMLLGQTPSTAVEDVAVADAGERMRRGEGWRLVQTYLEDGQWRTLSEIREATNLDSDYLNTSISGWTGKRLERRGERGGYEYKLKAQ